MQLTVDQHPIQAWAGETLATALLAHGITIFNRTASGKPRGPFCNMGTCFECQVQIAITTEPQFRWVRACMMTVCEGMVVRTGLVLPGAAQSPAPQEIHPDESGN